MIVIDSTWAMVELHIKYNDEDIRGYFWFNRNGDRYFMELLGDNKHQMYKVDESTGFGVDTVISKMTKVSNDDVKFEVQF